MKPILFNTEMVKAILEGRKTVTRRLLKGYALEHLQIDTDGSIIGVYDQHEGCVRPVTDYAPYHPGDILYVRETWVKIWYVDPDGYSPYDQPMYYYAADGTPDITLVDGDGFELDDQRIRWHPSIHMPKEAARLFLRVTDVRVERLRDITTTGLQNEGIIPNGYISQYSCMTEFEYWFDRFKALWDSTIKHVDLEKYGWDANPWVFVIEFEKITKEEALKC